MISFKKHYFALGVQYNFGTKRCSSCSKAVFKKRVYFYLLKTNHFLVFQCIINQVKTKRKIFNNLGLNIERLFHFLAHFTFTTRETELEYYQQEMNVRVALPVFERPKAQDLRKLGNFKKNTQILGFHGEYPAVHPKAKF